MYELERGRPGPRAQETPCKDRCLYKEPTEVSVAPTYTADQGTDSHTSVLRWKLIPRGARMQLEPKSHLSAPFV